MRSMIFCIVMLLANPAWGDFKPLTRDEPAVRMVLQEANNEPFAGMVAVAGVAYDRVTDRRWPSTLHDVIYQPAQFTGMRYMLLRYTEAQITRARLAVAEAAIGTRPCGLVLWYHTDQVFPNWRERLTRKCQLGAHIFYGD